MLWLNLILLWPYVQPCGTPTTDNIPSSRSQNTSKEHPGNILQKWSRFVYLSAFLHKPFVSKTTPFKTWQGYFSHFANLTKCQSGLFTESVFPGLLLLWYQLGVQKASSLLPMQVKTKAICSAPHSVSEQPSLLWIPTTFGGLKISLGEDTAVYSEPLWSFFPLTVWHYSFYSASLIFF